MSFYFNILNNVNLKDTNYDIQIKGTYSLKQINFMFTFYNDYGRYFLISNTINKTENLRDCLLILPKDIFL
jgi:hypothetical protein